MSNIDKWLLSVRSSVLDRDIEYDNVQYYDKILSVVKKEKYFSIKSWSSKIYR